MPSRFSLITEVRAQQSFCLLLADTFAFGVAFDLILANLTNTKIRMTDILSVFISCSYVKNLLLDFTLQEIHASQ